MRKWVEGMPCFYCGGKAEGRDHVVARKCGGARFGKVNLIPACTRCNGFKRHMSYREFKDYVRAWAKAHPLRVRPAVVVAESLGWRFWGEAHPEVYTRKGIRLPLAQNAPLEARA